MTGTVSLRLKFVKIPSGFQSDISAAMILGNQGCRHTILVPELDGLNHTPLPRCQRRHRIPVISTRCMGLATVCATSAL